MPRPLTALTLLVLLAPGAAAAQSASRYLPIDDWRMDYLEHLIRARVIKDPDPMTRPWHVSDVLAALHDADTTQASAATRATIRLLRAGLDSATDENLYRADGWFGGETESQARRNPLRAAGPAFSTLRGAIDFTATFGPFVGSAAPRYDERLRVDPDYRGADTTRLYGRMTDAYLSVQGQYGEVFFGNLSRNWGPQGVDGVLLSANPYSYDHLMVRVGTKVIRFETVITQLDDYTSPTTGLSTRRYYVTDRAVVRPHPKVVIDFGQSELLVRGANRSPELWWFNPFQIGLFTADDENDADSTNAALSWDLMWDMPGGLRLQGTLLLDDFMWTPSTLPNRMAGTVMLDAALSPELAVRAAYQFASSFAYRSQQGPDFAFTRRGIGLGRAFDDYDQATLSATVLPYPGILLTPEVTLLRQGEGAIQTSFTLPDNEPFLLLGVAQRTWRLALTGRAQVLSSLEVSGHAGVHFIQNAAHAAGATDRLFVGGVTLTYRFGGRVRVTP